MVAQATNFNMHPAGASFHCGRYAHNFTDRLEWSIKREANRLPKQPVKLAVFAAIEIIACGNIEIVLRCARAVKKP